MLLLMSPRLQILFLVGTVLNCGTYVAATTFNPLVWEALGTIPISQFGILHATNGAVAAFAALMAPTVRKKFSQFWSNNNNTKKKSTNNDEDSGGTEQILLLLLGVSILAYGLLTISVASTTRVSSRSPPPPSFLLSVNMQTIGAITASWLLSWVRGMAWPILGSAINTSITTANSRATILSLFAGSIKIGIVFTGILVGFVLQQKDNDEKEENSVTGRGLWESCALYGIVILITGIWFAKTGLPILHDDDTNHQKDIFQNHENDHNNAKTQKV
eukprot:CAMPEP_0194198390 /NCGR_PEP_ID=MMETSP0154-20130528/77736_1 /TAXON_ID=1049557 /ORGANISM="Thalassiothrix antarctica, Strain L6-D1" /LENGTH=273 /DNA_ID=CAMNT_0038923177 /DNA_START=776 /DNA_END=1593 /DNA_ORIENTATION=-